MNEKQFDYFNKWLTNRDSTTPPTEDELLSFFHTNITDVTFEEFLEIANKEINSLVVNGFWEE